MSEPIEYIKNQLPPQYKTWVEFWNDCKKHLPATLFKTDWLQRPVDFSGKRAERVVFECDVEYIKARCFEEIEKNLPTSIDVNCIRGAINVMHRLIEPCQADQIHNALVKLYKIATYAR